MSEILPYTIRIRMPDGATTQLQERVRQAISICEFAINLFATKNHEYGDAIQYTGLRGAIYELVGNSHRLMHMIKYRPCPTSEEWGEAVSDTLVDTLNYSIIGSLMLGDNNMDGSI